jgi:hypothetical protein
VTVWGAIEWWRIGIVGTRHVSLTGAIEDELAEPAAVTANGRARSGAGSRGGR